MWLERRWAAAELRQHGRMLSGRVVAYSDVADLPFGRERIAPGAFRFNDVILNVQHDRARPLARTGGGLVIADGPEALTLAARLPETREADDALELVRAGVLRGLSAEFHALSEMMDGGIRVVRRAKLVGVGLVDSPAYPSSAVETRARSGRTMKATIPSGRKLACQCSGVQCKFARFQAEAIESMWRDVWDEFGRWAEGQRDVVAGFGSYSESPLASASSGTLRGRMRGDDLEVEIDLPDSAVGAATVAAHDAAGVVVRPHLDAAESVGVNEDGVMAYSKAALRGIVVSATDQREGWPRPEIVATPDELLRRSKPMPGRRLWL